MWGKLLSNCSPWQAACWLFPLKSCFIEVFIDKYLAITLFVKGCTSVNLAMNSRSLGMKASELAAASPPLEASLKPLHNHVLAQLCPSKQIGVSFSTKNWSQPRQKARYHLGRRELSLLPFALLLLLTIEIASRYRRYTHFSPCLSPAITNISWLVLQQWKLLDP